MHNDTIIDPDTLAYVLTHHSKETKTVVVQNCSAHMYSEHYQRVPSSQPQARQVRIDGNQAKDKRELNLRLCMHTVTKRKMRMMQVYVLLRWATFCA